MGAHVKPERHTPGIYAITCIPTGRIYVGSSIGIGKRWVEHRHYLENGRHHSSALQRAWRKYGADAFGWAILEVIEDPDSLEHREQHFIDELGAHVRKGGFNSSPVSASPRGTKHSTETRMRNSVAITKKYQDPEYQERHREGQRRRFQRPEELEAHAARRSSRWLVSPPGNVPTEIINLKKFCLEIGISQTRMSTMGRGESPQGSYKGWGCVKLDSKKTRKPKHVQA